VAVASAEPYANHLHLTADNHTSTSSLSFYMLDALPATQPTAINNQNGQEGSIYYK